MNFLRITPALSSITRRQAPLAVRQFFTSRPLSTTPIRLATQGYGDGKGGPKAEDPQAQGSSNSTKENAEHPGPPAPSEGQGTGGATKAGEEKGKSPEDSSAQSGGARSKEAKETGSSPTGGDVGGKNDNNASEKSKGGNEPKIQSQSEPGEENDRKKEEEVKQHNKEFEERHDRAESAEPDKVDGKFWKGAF